METGYEWRMGMKILTAIPVNTESGLRPILKVILVLTATHLLSGCASFWGEPIESGTNAPDIFEMRQQAQQAYQESRWIDFQRAINAYQTSLGNDADQPKAWFNLSTAYLLNAQSAMQDARDRLEDGDPAKLLIEERLGALSALVHGRFEEGVAPVSSRTR